MNIPITLASILLASSLNAYYSNQKIIESKPPVIIEKPIEKVDTEIKQEPVLPVAPNIPAVPTEPIVEQQPVVPPVAPNSYWVEEYAEKNKFVNLIDGYGFFMPKNMTVVDMSLSSMRSVIGDEHRRVEIYKQSNTNRSSYCYYGNRFIENKIDHTLEYEANIKINGYSAYVLQWSRPKLKNINNDKNYYASVDISSNNCFYSFLFKSDLPFYECGGYLDMLNSFYTFTPTAQGNAIKFEQIQNTSWNDETKNTFEKYFSNDSNLIWGIYEPSFGYSAYELQTLENKIGYNFPVVLIYSDFYKEYDPIVRNSLEAAHASNKIAELTLQTTSKYSASEGNMVYDILDGKYDTFLYDYARNVAEFRHPVLFRFCNEMNGDWCAYSAYHVSKDAELYKELYKYVYSIFKSVGAQNVIWVWNPNERSYPDFKWNNELLYYPGDEYVDVVGLTGYNNGTYYKGEVWRSFKEIYDVIYHTMAERSAKPLMITEFSSSSVGGNKEAWFREMFNTVKEYPRIKVAILWNGCDFDKNGNVSRPYFLNDSDGLIDILKENLK